MAASNTSTLNLGGDDGMFGLNDRTPPSAKQSQSAAESTQTTQNSGSGPNNTPGKKPPGQEQTGDVYRYPYSKFQPGQDMLKISIFAYEKNAGFSLNGIGDGFVTNTGVMTPAIGDGVRDENGQEGIKVPSLDITRIDFSKFGTQNYSDNFRSIGGVTNNKFKKNARHIFLPIPQRISDSISVGYSEDTLNPLDAAGVAAASDLISGGGHKKAKQIMNLVNNVRQNPSSLEFTGMNDDAMTALKTGLATQIVNIAGRNISPNALISRASGQILQSNLELLFSSVTLRSFPFVFDFTPRDELEANEVRRIIRTIKTAMSPSNGGDGNKGGLLLGAPDLFQFTYLSGKNKHPFLNSFKIGVLTDMKVDYTASGTYATYSGKEKSPVHMRMQLTFKEINPIYKEDYVSEGPSMPGVGY